MAIIKTSNTDKQILYNIITREVHNFVLGVPMLSVFEGIIVNYIINYIDPYVNAFIDQNNQELDVDQLSSFTQQEVNEKIQKFKNFYNKEKKTYED